MGIEMLMTVWAFAEAIVQEIVTELGRVQLFSIFVLTVCLIGARFITTDPALRRTLLLGLVFVTFFASQGRSVINAYTNSGLYEPRQIMALSDLQIVENAYQSKEFSGRNVLALLVADYMPHAKVFLYDENLYSKELLGWSGRNPNTVFAVGGYQPTIDASFKAACLGRPHVIYKGRSDAPLFVAMPLSAYEKEERVFLMNDGLIDYLVPGSWREPPHE